MFGENCQRRGRRCKSKDKAIVTMKCEVDVVLVRRERPASLGCCPPSAHPMARAVVHHGRRIHVCMPGSHAARRPCGLNASYHVIRLR